MNLIKISVSIIIFLLCTAYSEASKKINNIQNYIRIKNDIQNNIKIIGNQRIPTDTILYYLDLKSTTNMTQQEIDEAVKKLYSKGFFSNIIVERDKNNRIIVKVQENPIVRKITIEGNKKLKSKEINKVLLTKEGKTYSKFQIDYDVKGMKAAYKKFGYYSVDVYYTLKRVDKNSVDITIIIKEGRPLKIREIKFLGNKNYSQKDLSNIIFSKKAVWYRLFSTSDLYDHDKTSLDKELLNEHYMEKGYADFKVLSVTSEITPNKEAFFLTYLISEGEIFNFGTSSIDSRIKGIKTSDLKKFIMCKENKVFNKRLLEQTTKKMTQYLRDNGYIFINVNYALYKDEKRGLVNVIFIVNETPKYFIRNINIIGNVRTLDRVIRRELRFYEGDSYNLSKIHRSKQRLENLGFFSAVDFEDRIISKFDDKIDLDVRVKELSTGTLNFQLAYNTTVGPIGSLMLSEYNFLGKGQIVNLSFSKGKRNSDISFGFTEPRFMDRDLAIGLDVFAVLKDKSQSSYSSKNNGITLRIGYDINEYIYHRVYYSWKNSRYSSYEDASNILKLQPSKDVVSSVGHSIIYDRLNNRVNPSNGYIIKLSQNFAGIGGNVKYLKHELYTSYYTSLYKDAVILNLIGRIGNINGLNGENVSVSNSFFIGQDYIRGFDVDGIGPRVSKSTASDPRTGDALGGKMFFTGTAEVQFPLGLPPEFDIRGVLFSDFGTLYNTDALKEALKHKNAEQLKEGVNDSKSIRASYGFGFVYDSPIGSIRLDWGFPFKKERFDNVERIRLSMGTNLN